MQLTAPGIYREEVPRDLRILPALSTANLALVGSFLKGPVGQPTFVSSDAEFRRIFGDFTPNSLAPLIWAAYGLNGGQFGYVLRLAPSDAVAAKGAFVRNASPTYLGISSPGAPSTINGFLPQGPVQPGTVEIQITDDKSVVGFDTGVNYAIGATSVDVVLGNKLIIPGTFETTIDGDLYADDGLGGIEQGVTPAGTINYETGEVSITLTGASATAGDVEVDYQYYLSAQATNEITATGAAGVNVYHGKLVHPNVLSDTNLSFTTFEWRNAAGNLCTATATGGGPTDGITGDATGSLHLSTGEWVLFVGNNTLLPGSPIRVTYWYRTYLSATDDGAGHFVNGAIPALTGPGTATIDYETGDINFNTVSITAGGQNIIVYYDRAVQRVEARDAGASGNDLRLQIVPQPSSLNTSNGRYGRFNVSVLEEQAGNGQFETVYTATDVELVDLTSARHIAQVINDDITGAGIVRMAIPANAEEPDGLRCDTLSGILLGEGTGSAEEVFVKLYLGGKSLVPGTLLVTYESGGVEREIRDDNLGGLTGDLDGAQPASIDYQTGVLRFTPDAAPDALSSILLESAYLLPAVLSAVADLVDGEDGSALTQDDVVGPVAKATESGIYGFNKLEEVPLILAIPDFAGVAAVEREAIEMAKTRADMIVLTSPPKGVTRDQAIQYRRSVLGSDSDRAVMYWPWIKVRDPLSGATVTVPPHGHAAGRWAYTDQTAGIQQAPAGTVFGRLQFVEGVERNLSRTDVGLLSQAGINSIYQPPRQLLLIYDTITLSDNIDFKYINVRRTKDYLDILVAEALGDLVFRSLGPTAWSITTQRIQSVLSQAFRSGLLRGNSETDAFWIQVDGSNNPPALEDTGVLLAEWGISIAKPGRFLISRSRILAPT